MKKSAFVVVFTRSKAGMSKLGYLLQDGEVGFGMLALLHNPSVCALGQEAALS